MYYHRKFHNKMNINKIGEQILEICSRKNSDARKDREELYKLYDKIERRKIIRNEENLDALFALHRRLFEIRNRKASYWEHEIGRLIINQLPFSISWGDKEAPKDEADTLKEYYNEDENVRLALVLSSKILSYAKEIIESEPDKTKRYKKRIAEALQWIDGLQHFYIIENIKDIYMNFIHDKDEDVQLFALLGLTTHFACKHVEEMTRKEIITFKEVRKNAPSRYNADAASKLLSHAPRTSEYYLNTRIGRIDIDEI